MTNYKRDCGWLFLGILIGTALGWVYAKELLT